MESSLVTLSNELAAIVQTLDLHVVSIKARRHYPASGLRWTADAVVAAEHTIQRDEEISVTLAGGTTVTATLAGRDPGTDLAVLKLPSAPPAPAPLVHAATVKAGEFAIVAGRSPNTEINASLGIISAVAGPWRPWRGGQLDAYLRLDAKLFPQSSGGAVVNARGEFIGIASPILSRIAGLAIPASTVKRVTEQILAKGFVPRGYFGVGVQVVPFSDDLRKKLAITNSCGLIVLSVEPDGPADKAGILIGDVVTSIGDAVIEQTDDLQRLTDSVAIGAPVKVSYIRAGVARQTTLILGERPGKRN
jgi:S1-C subfamily serine protease